MQKPEDRTRRQGWAFSSPGWNRPTVQDMHHSNLGAVFKPDKTSQVVRRKKGPKHARLAARHVLHLSYHARVTGYDS